MKHPKVSNIELLVDSGDYFRRMKEDVASAQEYVHAQALSFEGDTVGLSMGDLMLGSKAPDRRVVIDSFTRHVVNDRLVWAPRNLLDRGLRAEVRETRNMIDRLQRGGVGVRFSGPAGRFLERLPARNHKKLVAVDDRVAYVGGINFSDHNFLWHDLMLRVEDPDFVRFLRRDFEETWMGRPRASQWKLPGMVLHSLDGESNEETFARVFALVDDAKESLFVECPYVNGPFLDRLAAARRRGVSVTVVTPENNNFGLCRDAMIWHAGNSGFDVRFYPDRMTHMKALLVDGRTLVVGSANFDVLSYRFQQEFMAIVTDRRLVEDFTRRVVEEDLRQSAPCRRVQGSMAARITRVRLEALDRASAFWRLALPPAPFPAMA
ncbi:MAG TPA: phosphatidylserine/phosphatidylglycerophosphate/cardiolipin synthase family protein [Vicinamibacteria bacterium]|nr:phosphatidylserine/phosphatidylglycerophosphate/cardiolipin synthase family protein [Vicinamibacteria bacterium]